jgi:hypothetical protein
MERLEGLFHSFPVEHYSLTRPRNASLFMTGMKLMTASQEVRLRLVPQRFWAATRNMDKNQADTLMEKVMELAEKQDLDALRQFDFIVIDRTHRNIA